MKFPLPLLDPNVDPDKDIECYHGAHNCNNCDCVCTLCSEKKRLIKERQDAKNNSN
jgi:hypothetical protein